MTNRTRLLAASAFSFLSIPYFTACSEGTTPTPGIGNAESGGSKAAGGASSGGASSTSTNRGGSSAAVGGSVGSSSGGSTASSSDKANSAGGKTGSSDSKPAASGGKANSSGGSPGNTGGKPGATGGGTAVTPAGTTVGTGGKGVGTDAKTGGAGGRAAGAAGRAGNAAGRNSGNAGGSTASPAGGATPSAGSNGNGIGGAPSGDCKLPTLPEASALPVNKKLPDPFTFFDGTKLTSKDQWECRRQEILAMAAKYIYAPVPTKPDSVTGTVSGSTVNITAKVGSKSETFSATISGSGSVIALELSGGIFPSSRKKLSFGSGFEGKIKSLFGFTSDVNTNIANGWMIDRVMDVLEQNPSSGHDPTKIMVSGCSGCGKGAYLAGVFSRAPLVVIVESGGGGAANLRQAEWFRHGEGKSLWQCADAAPQSIDNLEATGICGPWITNAAQWLVSSPSKVNNLPFDTHLLLATIAPRYLLHFSNNNGKNSWCHLGGTCEALSAWAAKPVWKALGVPERMGFHMYSSNHCGNPAEATSLAGEFFKRAFEGSTTAKTDVMDIQDNGVQQPVSEWKSMWIDWDMETKLQ